VSLDLYFKDPTDETVMECFNFTHNIVKLADVLGIYDYLWHPEDNPKQPLELVPILDKAITELAINFVEYSDHYDSPNGWGTCEHFLPWLCRVRHACLEYPAAILEASI